MEWFFFETWTQQAATCSLITKCVRNNAHMLGIKILWVALAVEKNVSLGPIAIGFFGSQAEMSEASDIAHLVEQLLLSHG